MTLEAMTAELLDMRKQAEQTAQNIEQIARKLQAERQGLQQTVGEYNAKRVELFLEEFRKRGLTWCTCCSRVLPEGETKLILHEGREEYSCGYENSCYGFRDFSNLHRACPECRQKAYDRHGTRGAYSTQAKDQSSFYAFRVEKRDSGIYARKFGNWVKLKGESGRLPDPTLHFVECLVDEWNLPPRIELDNDGKLVVRERVAMAKAV